MVPIMIGLINDLLLPSYKAVSEGEKERLKRKEGE